MNSFNWDRESGKGLFSILSADDKNFDKRFGQIFKEIADVEAENLIIDLRFNSGGNVKIPGLFYSYIAQNTFTENCYVTIRDFQIPAMDRITSISGTPVKGPRDVEKFVTRHEKVFTEQTEAGYRWSFIKDEEKNLSKNAFQGKVYLIVSGRSISASSYFAALFKSNDRGPIVGEEMGGSYRALTAGKIITYQLPNTKLELEVPIMEVNFSEELYEQIKQDRILPDIRFNETDQYGYFLEKKDIEVEKILAMIKSSRE